MIWQERDTSTYSNGFETAETGPRDVVFGLMPLALVGGLSRKWRWIDERGVSPAFFTSELANADSRVVNRNGGNYAN